MGIPLYDSTLCTGFKGTVASSFGVISYLFITPQIYVIIGYGGLQIILIY